MVAIWWQMVSENALRSSWRRRSCSTGSESRYASAPLARSAADFYATREGLGGRVRRLDVAGDMAVLPYSIVRRRDAADAPAAARVLTLIRRKLADR